MSYLKTLVTYPTYVAYVALSVTLFVPHLLSPRIFSVTNWGDSNAVVLLRAMCLLLAVLKDIRAQVETLQADGWTLDMRYHAATCQSELGIFSCGVIGRAFIEMLKPFGPRIRVLIPTVNVFRMVLRWSVLCVNYLRMRKPSVFTQV